MKQLTSTIRTLGQAQASRGILPQLAMEITRAASEHDIKPEDALELYADYFQAASGAKTIDPFDNSVKANVSKLRQLIKAADPGLMELVIRQHAKLAKRIEVKPLYHAMVEAARYKNKRGKRPDVGTLAKIISRVLLFGFILVSAHDIVLGAFEKEVEGVRVSRGIGEIFLSLTVDPYNEDDVETMVNGPF